MYLHEVLDTWFESEVKPRLQGHAFLIRYADDAVIAFSSEDDARKVMDVLPKRFGKYGLKLHPEKTRLVKFAWPRRHDSPKDTDSDSFELLGFTHFWGKSRKDSWVVKRQTARSRFGRALQRVSQWCRQHLHDKIARQHAHLVRMVKGHYGYYGITGNADALSAFCYWVSRVWQKWLHRRSGRGAVAAIPARAEALPASAAPGRPQRLSRSPAASAADVPPYVANPWTKSRMPESGTSGSVGAPGHPRGNPTE